MSDVREALIAYLGAFITENKRRKIERVLQYRTHYVTIVLEDIYQPQNASAAIRTAECLGVQDIHIIEEQNRFRVSKKVVQGAAKWVTLHRYRKPGVDNTKRCLRALQAEGYRVFATTPNRPDATTPTEVPLDRPLALVFGNEEEGLSNRALQLADGALYIPMYGFTQSYNISVSVAITLSHIIHRLHQSAFPWRLSEEERLALKLELYRKSVRGSHVLEKAFLAQRGLGGGKGERHGDTS